MHTLKALSSLLRPPGNGVYTVSAGSGYAASLHKKIYGTAHKESVTRKWKTSLKKIKDAKIILIGVPSDIGAGFLRGANMGPLGLRTELYKQPSFRWLISSEKVVDIGDVFVIPQLLEDDLLNARQIKKSRLHLYNSPSVNLPVSPLSILEKTAQIIYTINPDAKIMALGGDHSISWPLIRAYYKINKRPFTILHFDAHTDLLKTRLGIDTCFGTWAYHANDLIGRRKRLVQVGIRASGKPKSHWEKTLNVKQYWAQDVQKNPKKVKKAILNHMASLDIQDVYISNDIDGIGSEYAASTGTPEPKGLTPAFVSELTREVGKQFNVIGSDLVEVAPTLYLNKRGEPGKTLRVGCKCTLDMIQAMIKRL